MKLHYVALTTVMLLVLPGCICSNDPATISGGDRAMAEADYERFKTLSGDWYLVRGVRLGVELESNYDEPFMTYSVSSGGHSVVEELFVGKPNEMTSVYYLDTGRLMMDHYCSLGNQPRMIAVAGPKDKIPFKLLSVSNMADENELHISSHSVEFDGPDELTVRWGATEDKKPMGGSFYTVKRAAGH
ncbi:MAG: hypothetical protein VX727_06995 [Planctomycetota bacterium]|nr:hypothetical protein [Planctomycetota bacterium]